jgi:hypothetical protein
MEGTDILNLPLSEPFPALDALFKPPKASSWDWKQN